MYHQFSVRIIPLYNIKTLCLTGTTLGACTHIMYLQKCVYSVLSLSRHPVITFTLSTVVPMSLAQRWMMAVLRRCVEVMPHSSKYFSSVCLCSEVNNCGSGNKRDRDVDTHATFLVLQCSLHGACPGKEIKPPRTPNSKLIWYRGYIFAVGGLIFSFFAMERNP